MLAQTTLLNPTQHLNTILHPKCNVQGISEITLKVLLYPKYYQNAIILLPLKMLKRYLNKLLGLRSKRGITHTAHTQ
jgi:hypothetical protein